VPQGSGAGPVAYDVPGGISFSRPVERPVDPTSGAASTASPSGADGQPYKRVRRSTPMLIRAEKAGVAGKLAALPASPAPYSPTQESWSEFQRRRDEFKELKAEIQRSNQQIVSRAEVKLLRDLR